MKSFYTLAWKEIKGQKMVSVLIWVAIILSTVMATTVGQSAGVLDAMRRQQAIAIGGDRYASFVQLTEAQAQAIERDSRISDSKISYAGRYIQVGSMDLNDLLRLELVEYWGDGLRTRPACTQLVEGRLPEKPMEIALPEDALQFLGFTGNIGDEVFLPLSKALRHGVGINAYQYEADFVLTGILKSNYLGYTYGSILGFVGEGTAAEVLPQEYLYYCMDIRTASKKDFQTVVDDLIRNLEIHELDTLYNVPYLNALGITYSAKTDSMGMIDDDGFSFLMLVGVLVVTLVLTAAGLVIYNILKIAITRRITQYGVLRAVGAGKGQLYRIVAAEVLLLCAFGIPAGMLCGYLSAKGILTAALNQLPPEMFLAQDTVQLQALIAENSTGKWEYLLVSALITLVFAFLAAAPAARHAAKVSPVAAMHNIAIHTATATKRFSRRKRKQIRGFERFYAALNLRRNRGRTAVTILSLVMSITVFVTLQGYLPHLSLAGAEPEHLGDYTVVNEYSGFSAAELERMRSNPNVAAVAAQQFSLYDLDEQYYPMEIETDFALGIGEKFQIFGMNDTWLDHSLTDRLSPEQLDMLKAGEACVVRNPIPMEIEGIAFGTTQIEEGRVIVIAGKKLPVLLSLSGYDSYFSVGNGGFINGVQVLVSDRLYPLLTGMDTYAEMRPVMRADADREAFDRTLDSLCGRAVGTTWVSYEDTDRQLAESRAQINMLAWGLILFIGLIGILNIINTVYTNIQTRITEIGTQRAIGMSMGSLYKTFLWEGAYYGIYAAVIGCVAGYLCTVLVEAAGVGAIQLTVPPVAAMIEASLLSMAACLLATAIPLRRIAKLSIVDSIEAVE